MPSRLGTLRGHVDRVLLDMDDAFGRRCGYVHLYGVAQFCALIALKRGQDAELAAMAGMLHDLHTYQHGDSADHAQKSADLAREVLSGLGIATEAETVQICEAIRRHSDKRGAHAPLGEVLVDADVMQHALVDPTQPLAAKDRERWENLAAEFALSS